MHSLQRSLFTERRRGRDTSISAIGNWYFRIGARNIDSNIAWHVALPSPSYKATLVDPRFISPCIDERSWIVMLIGTLPMERFFLFSYFFIWFHRVKVCNVFMNEGGKILNTTKADSFYNYNYILRMYYCILCTEFLKADGESRRKFKLSRW